MVLDVYANAAKKIVTITVASVLACLFMYVANVHSNDKGSSVGNADKTFDRVFLQSINNLMLLERIVKLVGVPPVKVGEASLKVPGEKYHWSGREGSSFNVRVSSGKIIDANIVTTEGQIIELGSDGELIEFGK